jgi:ABC-type enterobactin transport system permease subunit
VLFQSLRENCRWSLALLPMRMAAICPVLVRSKPAADRSRVFRIPIGSASTVWSATTVRVALPTVNVRVCVPSALAATAVSCQPVSTEPAGSAAATARGSRSLPPRR